MILSYTLDNLLVSGEPLKVGIIKAESFIGESQSQHVLSSMRKASSSGYDILVAQNTVFPCLIAGLSLIHNCSNTLKNLSNLVQLKTYCLYLEPFSGNKNKNCVIHRLSFMTGKLSINRIKSEMGEKWQ